MGAIARPLDQLLKARVELLVDRVGTVDLDERSVKTVSGRKVGYDHLVVAAGLTVDHSAVKGNRGLVAAYGDFHSTTANAVRVYRTLSSIRSGRLAIAVADPGHRCPPSPHEGVLLADELLRLRGGQGAWSWCWPSHILGVIQLAQSWTQCSGRGG